MRRASVRRALTPVLAGAVGALALLPPGPALAAVDPTYRVWSVVGVSGEYGLYRTDVPGGTRTMVEGSASSDVLDLSGSRDGSRIAYVRVSRASDGSPLAQEVRVRDTSGRFVRVLERLPLGGPRTLGVPVLSPDATHAAWEVYDEDRDQFSLRIAEVGTGTPITIATGFSPYAFLTDDLLLVQDAAGAVYTQPVSGAARTPVAGLSANVLSLALSPDGTRIAFGELDLETDPLTAAMKVAPVALDGDTATVGTPTTLSSTLVNVEPAFSPDGGTVLWSKVDNTVGARPGDLWSAPADGTLPAQPLALTSQDEADVATTTDPSLDTVAPGAVTPLTGRLGGTTAVVRWTNPSDADLSGVVVSRPGKAVFVPHPATSFADSGLALGTTYTYTLRAVDRSGNLAVAATRQLTAIQAGAVFGTPTSKYSATTSFPVRFAAGAPASTRFFVDYLPSGGTWKPWVRGATGSTRTFGAPGTTDVLATSAVAGGTYTFRVKAVDAFGNASPSVTSGKAVVPYDHTKARYSGGTTLRSHRAYLGSFRQLTTSSSYARVSLVGSRLMVVGWRCSTCGRFAIYDGATRIATVDTYASTLQARVLLLSRTFTGSGTHTFTLRPLGTPGRPNVALDGFAMQR